MSTLATSDLNQSLSRPCLNPPNHNCVATISDTATRLSDRSKIAEFKNGKITFRQKPISFDHHSETMREIVTFRSLLETSSTPLTIIPDDYLPLIAKLVHESDKSLNALTRSIQSSIVSPILESSEDSEPLEASKFLLASAVEHAIKAVADRTNYGIDVDIDKPPASLCVWRWEAKNIGWLPKSVIEKAAARLKERMTAKRELQTVFDELSPDDKGAILKGVKQSKTTKRSETILGPNSVEPPISISDHRGQDSRLDVRKDKPAKKTMDCEAIVKDKKKQEMKAVKAEKEKKTAEATKRSAAVFANFFKPTGISAKSHGPKIGQVSSLSSSSTPAAANEFQSTFRPFLLKKDSQLAPINWFAQKQKNDVPIPFGHQSVSDHRMVIDVDAEGQQAQTRQDQHILSNGEVQKCEVSTLTPNELLRSFLNLDHLNLPPGHRGLSLVKSPKSKPTYCVREIIARLNEAEVQGDQRAVRRILGLLKDRRKIPAKVFVFAGNNRPGYLGTWSQSSSIISPRRPFARDLLSFDYDHESDAEWEEEDVEDAEDIDSQDESMDDDASSTGSDMASWLVEGDEIDVLPSSPTQKVASIGCSAHKRKPADSPKVPRKKRKVVPLTPFQRGPIWEKEIGCCEYEPFRPMSIQLLNDTPFPVDPFTYTCEPVPHDKRDAGAVFVVPGENPLPPPAVAGSYREDAREIKRKIASSQPPPKTTFPDVHVLLLLQKIDEINTSSFVVLLDSLFQETKVFGIKKNALEVKLREVAEKDKVKKSWVVKVDAWTKHGLVKPT